MQRTDWPARSRSPISTRSSKDKDPAEIYTGGAAIGGEYDRPLSRGWSVFAGGEVRGRAYLRESDFNIAAGEVRLGGASNDGADQWRGTASFAPFWQKGAAPGDPQPTNDRRMGGVNLDWRHAIDTKTQVGLGLQVNGVRFPKNPTEDFDQVYVSASWLKSFERKGIPLVYLSVFATDDRARNSSRLQPFRAPRRGARTSGDCAATCNTRSRRSCRSSTGWA
jgi:hypothetical protein